MKPYYISSGGCMNIRYLTNKLIYGLFSLVEAFLALRFILELFGANGANGFVSWVYEMSGVLLDPFRGVFPTTVFKNTFVFDFSTLFAIVMYAILAILIFALLDLVTGGGSTRSRK
jgi:uncharacterized protein YggT (Ycf19 family)